MVARLYFGIGMKRVKCYGRAKTNLVDTSFKRDFFRRPSSESSSKCSSFQDFREKKINMSSSDDENTDTCGLHSYKLFASDIDINNSSSSSGIHYLTTVNPRKSLKSLYRNKYSIVKQKSIPLGRQCLSKKNFPIIDDSKMLDTEPTIGSPSILRNEKRRKKCRKFTRTSKVRQVRPSWGTASFLDPQSEPTSKLQSKSFRKNCPKYVKYSRSYKLRSKKKGILNHAPISVQPSCATLLLSDKKIGNKKKNKKKQIKDHCSISKSDSFWAAVQPKWSSIYEHSLKVEENVTNKATTKQCTTQNNQSDILSDSTTDDIAIKRKDLLPNLQKNSHVTPLLAKKSSSCDNPKTNKSVQYKINTTDTVDLKGIIPSEIVFGNVEKGEAISVNTGVCDKNEVGNTFANNIEKSQSYFLPVNSKKSKEFYSSTPICSPVSQSHLIKISQFSKTFSPFTQTHITSTPSQKFKQTKNNSFHMCNVSKISEFEHKGNDARPDISTGPSRFSSFNRNSFVLSRKSGTIFQKTMAKRYSSMQSLSKTCDSALDDDHCFAKSCSSSLEAMHLSLNTSEIYFQSILSKLLQFCGQASIIPFKEIYDWRHTTIRKIGEGTYGEVYTLVQNKLSSVVKVIPFSANNDKHNMQSAESILSEVKVSQCLSELRNNKNNKTKNYSKLKSVRIVKGEYPAEMLVAWEKFSIARTTYNSKPDIFDNQQLFAIIELEYGGKDMTYFMLRNAVEAESVLKQIAISLAIAEEVHLFEHRDLHLGNILVQRNASKSISYVLRGQPFSIPNHGVIVTIIDFTLSRVLDDGCIFYNDLADDESIFNQSGDIQFEIYRATKFHLNNEWHKSLLFSNILWLTFLCKKLLEFDYSRPSSKKHQDALKNIKVFENNLIPCKSALESLTACGIITSIPEREKDSISLLNAKTKLIDRKSLQKSSSRNPSLL
ncbi:hypothetical protein NPIL_705111 [Nephila pilipes]|uniref:non-specific serine/threonine protein kinase n=1 Tax=Nephila pilipes TaxID=299642 RepID=A0A8X6JU09_NEPPI|nr:hypothetical protein NPIL_705111 [Nephila pilipes]